jgi:hypothetical protein
MLEQSYLKSKRLIKEDTNITQGNTPQLIEEGMLNFIYNAFKKIAINFETPEIEKIKNQFNKDLPALVTNIGDVNQKELNIFIKNMNQKLPSVIGKTINESLKNKEILIESFKDFEIVNYDKNSDMVTFSYAGKNYKTKKDDYEKKKKFFEKTQSDIQKKPWRINNNSTGVNTVGGEKVKDNESSLDKIKYAILGLFNFTAASSLFYLLWEVVIKWWIGHRAMIPLELNMWGKVSVIILLLAALVNGIYEKYYKK